MKKFFSLTTLKLIFCISIALFVFIIGIQSAFCMTESDSLSLEGSRSRVYSDTWTNTGTIVMPIGANQTFIGRMSITNNAQQQSEAWSYAPYGYVNWDIYTRELTYDLVHDLLYDQSIYMLAPIPDQDMVYSWEDTELIEIPMSYFFDSLNYVGATFRFVIRPGDNEPGNTNRFYFILNQTGWLGTYDTPGSFYNYSWDAQNAQEEAEFGSHPRLTWLINVFIYSVSASLDYAESSSLGYSELPRLNWYPFFELETPSQSLENALNQEIVDKLDTIDDTLNQSDPRASDASEEGWRIYNHITGELEYLEDHQNPDPDDYIDDVSETIIAGMNSNEFLFVMNKVRSTILNVPLISAALVASVGIALVKFIIFGKG